MPVTDNRQNRQSPPAAQRSRVYFFDTTLRDGEQSPGCTMHHGEKLRLAHQIAALGVDILEAGFAIASDGDSESIRTIAREVRVAPSSPRSPAASARTSKPPPAASSPPPAPASTPSSPPPTYT
jgi:hypothetical protein